MLVTIGFFFKNKKIVQQILSRCSAGAEKVCSHHTCYNTMFTRWKCCLVLEMKK